MTNELDDEVLERLHALELLAPGLGASLAQSLQQLGSKAPAFLTDRFVEVHGLDVAVAGRGFRDAHDVADARRDQDAFPHAVFPGAERSLELGVHFAGANSIFA